VKLTSSGFQGVRGDQREVTDFATRMKKLRKIERREDLDAELAKAVAQSFDLRVYHHSGAIHSGDKANDQHDGLALIAALPAEDYLAAMRELFDPADYFKRSPARVASAAIAELAKADRDDPVVPLPTKKADLAQVAAEKAKRLGWLPPELRHPEYALIGQTPKKTRRRAA
jgi:hypothetical protein